MNVNKILKLHSREVSTLDQDEKKTVEFFTCEGRKSGVSVSTIDGRLSVFKPSPCINKLSRAPD